MPAFTYLCKNVHVSVAHNTVTLYIPKNIHWYSQYQQIAALGNYNSFDSSIKEIWPLHLYNPNDSQDPFVKRLAPVQPVHRNYPDHHFFHDDEFDREVIHFHMKFTKNIDDLRFDTFLTILVEKNVINAQEKENGLIAFRQSSHDAIARFYDELTTIQLKALELKEKALINPNYQKSADAAIELYDTLKHESRAYMSDKKAETYDTFQSNCHKAIKKAKLVLDNHRGWGDVLLNVGAAILGLGIFYLAGLGVNYYYTHGEHLFFHCETDSTRKIKQFEKAQMAILRI